MAKKSNQPPVILELSRPLAEFLLNNCDSNLTYSLQILGKLSSRTHQEKLVAQMENFKAVRALLQKEME